VRIVLAIRDEVYLCRRTLLSFKSNAFTLCNPLAKAMRSYASNVSKLNVYKSN